jgi:hypothetical protein
MRLDLIKTQRRIQPATEQDEERLRLVRVGDLLPVSIKKPRNGRDHRRFWALVRFIRDNHDRLHTDEAVVLELKLRAGHYREHITGYGEILFVPKSISYDEVDQTEFLDFYQKALRAACTELLPKVPQPELEQYLERITTF